MTIAGFKSVCETLGRFANVRETAKEPQDRIVVQASNGLMKLIAGDDDSTVVVDCGETTCVGKAVVSSRLLLTAAKSLRGKGTVGLDITPSGAQLSVKGGGKVKLNRITNVLPDFLRLPRTVIGSNNHQGLDTIAKLLPSVTTSGPWEDIYMVGRGSDMYLVAYDGRQYVEYLMTGPFDGEPHLQGRFPAKKLNGLRGFTQPGTIEWNADVVVFKSGGSSAVFRLERNPPWFPPRPELPDGGRIKVEVDRKALVNALQGVKPNDEHARVYLSTQSSGLVVSDWKASGEVSMNATISGTGRVGLDGDRLWRLASNLPGKTVRLVWAEHQPAPVKLVTKEAPECLTLLAPVI